MKTIRQHDRNDCGAACLASIASHYGKPTSVAQVRLLSGTVASGTTLADLQHGALRLGFQAAAVSGDLTALSQSALPAIVHLHHGNTGSHFVVVTRIGPRKVSVLDPADGRRHRWPVNEFTAYWSGAALLLLPAPDFLMDGSVPASPWKRIIQLLLPYRRQFAKAFALAVMATLLAMTGSVFVWLLTDRVILHHGLGGLHHVGALFALAIALQVAASAVRKTITLRTARLVDTRLLRSYCQHMLHLPQAVHHHMQPGELLSRMGDAVHIRRFANDLIIQTGVPILALVFVLIAALASQPALALWLILTMAAYAVVYQLCSTLQGHIQRKLMTRDAALDAQFTETALSIPTIKQLGLAQLHGHKLTARIHDFLSATHASGRLGIWSDEVTSLLAQGFSLALLWGGGTLVMSGSLTLGELLAFYTLSGYFSAAAAQLMPLARHAQEARVSAERLYGLLDLPPDERQGTMRLVPDDIFPVRVQDVRFAYRRGEETLRGLNMEITAGTITVIRGASGSGKSTLFSLLLRQHAPTGGGIYLGIHPLELVSRETLHNGVSTVPQRVQLFDDTLAANICPWEKPDPKRIAELCHALDLFPLIESLPLKLDTPLGRDGCLLSGGQRQLVALARALYRQPQLLLLDEATSGLDAATEARIHRALLDERRKGMAIVWASHYDSSERIADRVWHLHAGQLTVQNNRPPYPSRHAGDTASNEPAPKRAQSPNVASPGDGHA